MIDITQPLELSDGTRVEYNPHTPHYASEEGWADFKWRDGGKAMAGNFMLVDGTSRLSIDHRTLRNARPVLTGVEAIGRMEDLLRRMAARDVRGSMLEGTSFQTEYQAEAREIVAMLPEVVKTDEGWAFSICREWYPEMTADYKGRRMGIAKACIAKGRELALAERGE